MSRHAMSCTSCHVMPRHVTSCHVMSRHVMSCHIMSRLAPSCNVMPRHVMSRHVISRHVTSCYVISRRKSQDGHTTNASLSTDFFHMQFKLSMTVIVGCPEGCRYHTASAVYDLVCISFTTKPREN